MSHPGFDSFKTSLTGDVVTPGDDGYKEGLARWLDNVVQPAQYIVYPKTPEDVSAAVKFANANKLEIAICGGGHSWSVSRRYCRSLRWSDFGEGNVFDNRARDELGQIYEPGSC